MAHYEIDEVQWRVAEMLGDSFSLQQQGWDGSPVLGQRLYLFYFRLC